MSSIEEKANKIVRGYERILNALNQRTEVQWKEPRACGIETNNYRTDQGYIKDGVGWGQCGTAKDAQRTYLCVGCHKRLNNKAVGGEHAN